MRPERVNRKDTVSWSYYAGAVNETWLDTLVAVPTVGLAVSPTFQSSAVGVERLRGLFQEWDKKGLVITVQTPSALGLQVETADGYLLNVDSMNVVIRFQYRTELLEYPGGFPALSPIKRIPYSVLLTEVQERITQVCTALFQGDPPSLKRIGVVAACRMEPAECPPGVTALNKHLVEPWEGPVSAHKAVFTVEVGNTAGALDQCHYQLEHGSTETKVSLDWQRLLKSSIRLNPGDLRAELEAVVGAAQSYFERVGEGDV
jgi:hypothetical protein